MGMKAEVRCSVRSDAAAPSEWLTGFDHGTIDRHAHRNHMRLAAGDIAERAVLYLGAKRSDDGVADDPVFEIAATVDNTHQYHIRQQDREGARFEIIASGERTVAAQGIPERETRARGRLLKLIGRQPFETGIP